MKKFKVKPCDVKLLLSDMAEDLAKEEWLHIYSDTDDIENPDGTYTNEFQDKYNKWYDYSYKMIYGYLGLDEKSLEEKRYKKSISIDILPEEMDSLMKGREIELYTDKNMTLYVSGKDVVINNNIVSPDKSLNIEKDILPLSTILFNAKFDDKYQWTTCKNHIIDDNDILFIVCNLAEIMAYNEYKYIYVTDSINDVYEDDSTYKKEFKDIYDIHHDFIKKKLYDLILKKK